MNDGTNANRKVSGANESNKITKFKVLSPVSHKTADKISKPNLSSADNVYSIDDFPIFPENYHSSGLIILPHSNIAEPFEIWYAPSSHKSRIDYYYGRLFTNFSAETQLANYTDLWNSSSQTYTLIKRFMLCETV